MRYHVTWSRLEDVHALSACLRLRLGVPRSGLRKVKMEEDEALAREPQIVLPIQWD